eukprot:1175528-Prorocentrum_minimum.AAC.3
MPPATTPGKAEKCSLPSHTLSSPSSVGLRKLCMCSPNSDSGPETSTRRAHAARRPPRPNPSQAALGHTPGVNRGKQRGRSARAAAPELCGARAKHHPVVTVSAWLTCPEGGALRLVHLLHGEAAGLAHAGAALARGAVRVLRTAPAHRLAVLLIHLIGRHHRATRSSGIRETMQRETL